MVGPAGFEPTIFTRNRERFSAPTGFFTAPDFLHPNAGPQTRVLNSGARRHPFPAPYRFDETWLDYGPLLQPDFDEVPIYRFSIYGRSENLMNIG